MPDTTVQPLGRHIANKLQLEIIAGAGPRGYWTTSGTPTFQDGGL